MTLMIQCGLGFFLIFSVLLYLHLAKNLTFGLLTLMSFVNELGNGKIHIFSCLNSNLKDPIKKFYIEVNSEKDFLNTFVYFG